MNATKTLILLLLVCTFATSAKADQLQWLSKKNAQKAVKYLNKNKILQFIDFCACCDKGEKSKIKIQKAYIRATQDPKYFEVVIVGFDETTQKMYEKAIDLAYAHIQQGSKAHCLGKLLGFECKPCTEPFDWN